MSDPTHDTAEPSPDATRFQVLVLAAINEVGNPFIVLHGLFELAGALASAMVRSDGARVEWVLGMVEALKARVLRDATAAPLAPGNTRQH